MNKAQSFRETSTSRRDFLKQSSGALAGAALASTLGTRAHAGENNCVEIALVGCGGRGTGAAENALSTEGPTQLAAMADVFPKRIKGSLNSLGERLAAPIELAEDRQFMGFEAYKEAIDAVSPGGLVILATPPTFRPLHLEYAVDKDCHVFMEKSFAIDGPGVRRVLAAGKKAAAKNLKIAGGLMSRHYVPLEQAVEQIHGGLIGDVITCWAYREHHAVGFKPKTPNETEMAHQIRNYSCYTWINGSFLLDWLIHNLDICCWIKGDWPVSAQGQGGRQVREKPDQMFDHYSVEYTFGDGTHLLAQGRHMDNCWGFFGDVIHGTKGSAVLGEGVTKPRLFRGHNATAENQIWNYEGPRCNAYQNEHDLLFDAIRNNKPYNEAERSAHAALTGILGRMAAQSGQKVTWEQALTSNLELAPGLDRFAMDSTPPVQPDEEGMYPVAMPGITQVL